MTYKIIFGLLSIGISFIGYIPYFRDIFKNKTKPHVFSWLSWSLIGWIVFFAQIVKGAGPGAWITFLGASLCLVIAVLAIFKGEKRITLTDWLAFGGALIGLILWKLTANPLSAVILVTITDALAFIPTFRKAYNKPYEETIFSWLISSLKYMVALVAMDYYNLTVLLYPISLTFTNGTFTIMLYLRRRKLGRQKNIARE
jgi:hypothetical protein